MDGNGPNTYFEVQTNQNPKLRVNKTVTHSYQPVDMNNNNIENLLNPTTSLQAANKQYVDTAVANLVDSAPEMLNTLSELANALGDDPNFATTITNQIASKADAVHTHLHTAISDFDQGV